MLSSGKYLPRNTGISTTNIPGKALFYCRDDAQIIIAYALPVRVVTGEIWLNWLANFAKYFS
jgi:hypothetical protein